MEANNTNPAMLNKAFRTAQFALRGFDNDQGDKRFIHDTFLSYPPRVCLSGPSFVVPRPKAENFELIDDLIRTSVLAVMISKQVEVNDPDGSASNNFANY